MTLVTVYYIGQTIAVGAILASLVAIYIQQRKDHAFAQAESQREILQQASQWFDQMLAHPSGLESVRRCLKSFRGATPREQAEFSQYMVRAVSLAEQATFMRKDKLIHDSSHVKLVMLPAMHIVTPGGREYWAAVRPAFGVDVVAAIDKVLEESPPPVDTLYQIFPYFHPDAEATEQTPPPDNKPDPKDTP